MTTLSDKMHDALVGGHTVSLDSLRDVVSAAIEDAYREGYEAASEESPSPSTISHAWNQSDARANL